MEEFLNGCGKKKRNQFAVSNPERTFVVDTEPFDDKLEVTKSEWGFVDIRLLCDAPFVSLSKNRIQMNDFTGKHAEVPYQILPRLMHGGKNYARITLENCFQKQEVVITASIEGQHQKKSTSMERNAFRYQLEQIYLSFVRGEKEQQEWCEESLEILSKAKALEPNNQWNMLFSAYVYLTCDRMEEADRELIHLPRNLRNQRSPLAAFYLYLTTFGEDSSYVHDVTVKVREIFLKYPSHPVLAWILTQIDEALIRNAERKFHMIKRFATDYSISPIFYQEAANLLINQPNLLHSQEQFENRLIYWMDRHNMLNEELATRILAFSQTKKQFDPHYFRLMTRCYKLLQDAASVKTICVYLIKTNQYGEAYFPWFLRGVEQHLKIAGLYEGYMLSWSKANGKLPDEIIKYFSMNNSLPARRKALLFSYVVRNKQRLGKDWDSYMVMVKNFAVKELEKGHISEEHAIIYEEVKRQFGPEKWDSCKKEAESCYRVHTQGEKITFVHVLQKDVTVKQRVPVYQDSAYIYLYRRPFVILYEDASGTVYAAKDSFRIRKMISGQSIYAPKPSQTIPEVMKETPVQMQDVKERLSNFAGSIDEMYDLILRAEKAGITDVAYKEQLMIRMLFTGKFVKEHEKIFQQISGETDAVFLLDAYVAWFSRSYLLEQKDLPDVAFPYMGKCIQKKHRMNAFCEAAFLKAYVNQESEEWEPIAEDLLCKYLMAGKYFDFYEKLSVKLKRKYLLMGVQVIQYQETPGKSLYIHMKRTTFQKGEPVSVFSGKEGMIEVLPGIYTQCVRLLDNDQVEYEIVDRTGEYLYSGKLTQPTYPEGLKESRYSRICDLIGQPMNGKIQQEYANLSDLAEIFFVPIEE
jgi:hypothetical protein